MFHAKEKQLRDLVSSHIAVRYGIDVPVVVEEPRQPEFGELAVPVAFHLAKQLKKAPKAIAQELVDELSPIEGFSALEVAGNGYINVRVDRARYGQELLKDTGAVASKATGELPAKLIVEHTNINPNKAAHVGHVRNAVLGDTFVRMLRAAGETVEVQNYIDNTGVQVADVVAGFHYLEKKSLTEVRALANAPKFDYVCWDSYARVSQYFADNPDSQAWRTQTLHAIESGAGELADMAHLVADAIALCHLATMRRLGIHYDVLPRESEILHLQFWATAFEQLKARKAIYLETEGNKKDCWVMAGEHFRESEDSGDSKVIVRSNGIVTYVGKDIAYQLWKFGLLGKDFYYTPLLTESNGHVVWVSTDVPQTQPTPVFGKGTAVYNVIDSRQSYLQDVVAAGLRALGYTDAAEKSTHFSYEMVALTPRTCADLGIELKEEDKKKAYVEVSGRKGLGVKADDLIDKLIERALVEVNDRHAEAPEAERRHVATQIAIGALRYFMLKFTRNTVIAFDLQEALSFEGETGPYAQYAAVRANRILREFATRGGTLPNFETALAGDAMGRQLAHEDFWQLALTISKVETAVARAVAGGEPSNVAKYAFQLAQAFNGFYHDYNVIHETDEERRTFLLWMTSYFARQLTRTLDILGIPVPIYM